MDDGSSVNITNSIFEGNSSSRGGGSYVYSGGQINILNSLFYDNYASNNGGAVRNYYATCNVTNTVMWLNAPDQIATAGSNTTVRYSNVQGGYTGDGNINADPMFIDPSNRDFHLLTGSACIDSADGDAAPEIDMEGNPRVDDPNTTNTGVGTIDYTDMGPFEFQP